MRGVGTELLQTAVEHLDSDSTIAPIYLNAAPSAVRLYQRFGFVEVGDVFRWRKDGGSDNDTAQFVTSLQEIGICRREEILRLDSQCWQDCRSIVLEQLIKERRCITLKDTPAFLMYYEISGISKDLYAIGPWDSENGG